MRSHAQRARHERNDLRPQPASHPELSGARGAPALRGRAGAQPCEGRGRREASAPRRGRARPPGHRQAQRASEGRARRGMGPQIPEHARRARARRPPPRYRRMSIEAAMSRISQIQAMLSAGIAPPATTQQPTSASFATQLQSAKGAALTTAATAATPTATATTPTASTGPSELPAGTPYGAEITAAAKANGVDPALLAGLVKQESGF